MFNNYIIIKGKEPNLQFTTLLQFDGGSVPNPGPSAGGAVMYETDRKTVIFEGGEYLDYATNNQAEYTGLLCGLNHAIQLGIKNILIEGDSQLIIFQTIGKWKVNNEHLILLNIQVKEAIDKFDFVGIRHVYRKDNKYADRITNEVIKTKKSYFLNMT
jgi:ribonuclease HI